MIEVEKKFKLSAEQKNKLLKDAKFLGEKTFTDVYFDNAKFSLTSRDIWLRSRDGIFELKLPVRLAQQDQNVEQYEEVVGEELIRGIFAVARQKSFTEDIAKMGHKPFCECTTVRKKYQKEGFVLDLDEVSFAGEDLQFAIAEIELMVEKQEEMANAANKILEFARMHDLCEEPLLGKVGFYLKEKRPQHFAELVSLGVFEGDEK